LQTTGYGIAVDDFGSGFSNFTYLENIRPHLVKIDRSIVVRAGAEADSGSAFLAATVDVAKSLNCAVLAEGIEDEQEEAAVTSLAIDYMQGYRYGRPTPLGSLLKRLGGDRIPAARAKEGAPRPAGSIE
jgi:EAL domain-containing protein (putative c-di-GMP-specific phosphodiesterase class I)